MTDLEAAWNDLHDAKPARLVRRPDHPRGTTLRVDDVCLRHGRAPEGRAPVAGVDAVAQSELEVVREMARCLKLIGEGLTPD